MADKEPPPVVKADASVVKVVRVTAGDLGRIGTSETRMSLSRETR